MERRVALLRGVNVGGRTLPMAELRALAEGIGWSGVATYIQSGNLLFEAGGADSAAEAALEAAIADAFGFDIPVIVRSRGALSACLDANPFPEAARESPNRLLLFLARSPPTEGAEAALEARAAAGERAGRAGEAIWIHFPEGVGCSKLTPALIDRSIGSPATGRNHRTIAALLERLAP